MPPYGLLRDFERAVAVTCCCRPNFYGRAGHAIDPEAIQDPTAKLLIQTAQLLARELGRGSDRSLLAIQRIRRWVGEGKVTQDQLDAAFDCVEAAEEVGLPNETAVLNELVPVLKKRKRAEVLEEGYGQLKGKGNLKQVAEQIEQIERLGETDTITNGVRMGAGAFAAIEQLRYLDRLPTGIDQLDNAIEGGLWRGALGLAIGGPGDGKSMFLSHVSAQAYLNGLFIGAVTLELPEPIWIARIMSNVTQIPINEILNGSLDRAKESLADLAMERQLGILVVREMPAQATTVEDIIEWVERSEEAEGREMDVLAVDYVDKLGVKDKKDSSYTVGLKTTEGLRLYLQRRKKWGWTASQSRRKQEKKKAIKDLDDVADSMHKVRVCDLAVTLNADDDGEGNRQMSYLVAKNRVGESRRLIGPLPVDFGCGRMSP